MKATDTLRDCVEKVHSGKTIAYETAQIYTALGDYPKAIEMLQIAFDERDSQLIFLNVDPLLAPASRELTVPIAFETNESSIANPRRSTP